MRRRIIIIIIIIIKGVKLHFEFFTPVLGDGFSLKFERSQVSRTLLSILADLNNAVVLMLSTCSLISKSFRNCTKSSNYNRYHSHFHVPQFFQFPSKVQVLIFLLSFSFTQWSPRTAKSTIRQVLFFLLIITRTGNLAKIRWSICISKSQRVCVFHSPGRIQGCAYTICTYGQISISRTIPSRSPCQPTCV